MRSQSIQFFCMLYNELIYIVNASLINLCSLYERNILYTAPVISCTWWKVVLQFFPGNQKERPLYSPLTILTTCNFILHNKIIPIALKICNSRASVLNFKFVLTVIHKIQLLRQRITKFQGQAESEPHPLYSRCTILRLRLFWAPSKIIAR